MQALSRLVRRPHVALQRRFYSSESIQSLANDLASPLLPPSTDSSGYPKPNPPTANPFNEEGRRQLPRYRLHCHSSRNNTITTFTRPDGDTVAWFSGGSCKFKKGNRASYEAGYQCAVRVFEQIEKMAGEQNFEIDLFFKGFGQGREALQKALLSGEGDNVRDLVISVTDRTPLKIGGTRSKKARRL
ncbi:hypothetical protein APHAL10511_002151 [Amanita phalloides]|nr:hypothetical protein APHAL10511_002151 [Amanita phalloides]